MKFSVISMFPELFDAFVKEPDIKRSIASGRVNIEYLDLKEMVPGSFRHIDDSPYGGGAGMLIRCEPVVNAIRSVKVEGARVILLSPEGQPYTQKKAHELAELVHVVLICGHYEGFDARIDHYIDEKISVGDYILTGGELPAMTVMNSVIRLLDGTIRKESTKEESFEDGLLEYPQYTHPKVFEGYAVPNVLLSGNHEAIKQWHQEQALKRTKEIRSDLLIGKEK